VKPVRVGVVIPVFNERELLERAVARLVAAPLPGASREVFLVDDGSSDGTREVVALLGARPGVVALMHDRNRGKGAAVRKGMDAAFDAGVDAALIHDGDLEYDPADHARLVAPILGGTADAVIGARFLDRDSRARSFVHRASNHVLTLASNQLTGLELTDMECCLKAFSREVLARLKIEEDRFGVEPEIVAKLARMTLEGGRPARVAEVAVTYAGRTRAEGKKIGWRDGVAALWCIAKYSLREEYSPQRHRGTEKRGADQDGAFGSA